jgi:cytosine permease
MALLGVVEWRLGARELPLMGGFGESDMLLRDVAAFVGFVAVFAVRAPDFSSELRTRRSLVACALCLVVPMTLAALVGVGVHLGTGTVDVVALLAGTGSLRLGNLVIAVGVVAPTLAALHSGRLAA